LAILSFGVVVSLNLLAMVVYQTGYWFTPEWRSSWFRVYLAYLGGGLAVPVFRAAKSLLQWRVTLGFHRAEVGVLSLSCLGLLCRVSRRTEGQKTSAFQSHWGCKALGFSLT
jgi:hypothetical protein